MSLNRIIIKEEPENIEELLEIIKEIEEIVKTRKIHLLKIEIRAEDNLKYDSHNVEIEKQSTDSINQVSIKRNLAVSENQNCHNQRNILLIKSSQNVLGFITLRFVPL